MPARKLQIAENTGRSHKPKVFSQSKIPAAIPIRYTVRMSPRQTAKQI